MFRVSQQMLWGLSHDYAIIKTNRLPPAKTVSLGYLGPADIASHFRIP